MDQILCEQLAKSVVSLVAELKVGQKVTFCGQEEGLPEAVQRMGMTIVPVEAADLCVCFCSDIPNQALARRIPLILVERNGSNKEYLTQLLAGNMAIFRQRVTSEKELLASVAQQQYAVCAQADITGNPEGEMLADGFGAAGNTVHRYLNWCKSTVDTCSDIAWFVRACRYDNTIAAVQPPLGKRPFLTVLTRTQGMREAGLTEVLLCLAAQTDRDFEVLIVGHRLNDQQKAMVLRLIEETPSYLRERIRFELCSEEGRTAPLNHGFASAHGEYVSILDDDDIVMDNWVEEFHKVSRRSPGSILHAYAVGQDWTYIPQIRGQGEDLRASSGYSRIYCKPYRFQKQFLSNSCPTLCLAYPASIVQQWGFRFDPALNITEDWDFLMRSSVFCGVEDTDAVTSIYRWWTNGVTSATLHDKKEWHTTYRLLTKRFSKMQMVLPVKSIYGQDSQTNSHALLRLLPSSNGVFSDQDALTCQNPEDGPLRQYEFKDLPDGKFGGLLRIDPFETINVILLDCRIQISCHNGKDLTYTLNDLMHNGWWIDDGIAFVDDAPQLYLRLPAGCCAREIQIQFKVPYELDTEPALRIGNALGCSSAELKVQSAAYHGPLPAHTTCYGNHLTCEYDLSDVGSVEQLLFSPCKRGSVIIQDMKVTATTADGQEIPLHMKHNGFHRPNAAIFLYKPVYRVSHPGEIKHLSFDFRLDGEISDGAALSIHDPVRYVCKKLLGR